MLVAFHWKDKPKQTTNVYWWHPTATKERLNRGYFRIDYWNYAFPPTLTSSWFAIFLCHKTVPKTHRTLKIEKEREKKNKKTICIVVTVRNKARTIQMASVFMHDIVPNGRYAKSVCAKEVASIENKINKYIVLLTIQLSN